MRFTKECTKEIRQWLKINGFQVGCRLGNEWEYHPDRNFIVIPKLYNDKVDILFLNFLEQYNYKESFDCITLSFLHELGHAETEHLFTDEEWEQDNQKKENICSVKYNTEQEFAEINYNYWKTATELSANLWLIQFTKEHFETVQDLENIIEKYYNFL